MFAHLCFNNGFIEIRCTHRTARPLEVYDSVGFFVESQSYDPFSNIFVSPKRNPQRLAVTPHFSPSSPASAAMGLLSVSVDLPTLDISYKWNRATRGLRVWLLSLGITCSALVHAEDVSCLALPLACSPRPACSGWGCGADPSLSRRPSLWNVLPSGAASPRPAQAIAGVPGPPQPTASCPRKYISQFFPQFERF